MVDWKLIFGIAIAVACFGLMVWKAAQYVRRGWKDHLWIWSDAHRAARSGAMITGFLAVANLVRHGIGLEFWAAIGAAAIFITAPYIAYAIGRLSGIWHRSRQRRTPS